MTSTETIDVSSLTQLSVDAFRHAGLSVEDSGISTRILVVADMMGLSTHGVVRIPVYACNSPSRTVQKSPSIERRLRLLAGFGIPQSPY